MKWVIFLICGLAAAGFIGALAINVVEDPLKEERRALSRQLERLRPERKVYVTSTDLDFQRIRETITGKDALWDELIPPPPKPPPPKKTPNFGQLLKGVSVGQGQIGDKIRIIMPGSPRGEFLGVGDKVNLLTISEITPEYVEFSLDWVDGETYTHRLQR